MNLRFLITLIVTCCLSGTAFAQYENVQVGKRLTPVAATAATGKWLEEAALNPAYYGKVRGVSPAAFSGPQIAIYTSELSEDFFKIAVAIDKYIDKHPELAWSFVQVRDTKGAGFGGYTVDELRVRLAEIEALTKKHGIKHLSFLVAAYSYSKEPQKTVVLVHVRPAEDPGSFSVVDWVCNMPIATLQRNTLSQQIAALDAASRPKS